MVTEENPGNIIRVEIKNAEVAGSDFTSLISLCKAHRLLSLAQETVLYGDDVAIIAASVH